MIKWAEHEVEARKRDFPDDDYGNECAKAALEAFKILCRQGHSGYSIQVTKEMLNAFIDGKPLTMLSEVEDDWYKSDESTLPSDRAYESEYRNRRYSGIFKEVYKDGTVKYHDIHRVSTIDQNGNPWYCGRVSKLVHEMYPITFPYYPENYKVYVRELTFDGEKEEYTPGTYNTTYIDYLIKPDGERVDIKRKFREEGEDWVEVPYEE